MFGIGNMMPPSGWKPEPSDREKLATMTAQRDELLTALKAVVETGDDCPLCDRGRLRNPQKTHWPECPFGRALAVISKAELHE